jgi:lipid-A-disaccharide synthase
LITKNNNNHFFFIAGEPSGDIHGAQIIANLKKQNPNIIFSGIGGTNMENQGLQSLVPIEQMSVMGFWEVIKQFNFFLSVEKLVMNFINKNKPTKIILIDYPGFNLRLAKKIKQKFNISITYYISPQIWAWKEKRIETIKQYIDYLIVIFPFEVDWYAQRGVKTHFFGHPMLNNKNNYNIKTLNSNQTFNIALCPGSRMQEITKHLPILIQVIDARNNINHKNIKFFIQKSSNIKLNIYQQFIKNRSVKIVSKPIIDSFQSIDLAIVASGTATLECAITLTPMIVIYKMSWISWLITKLFVQTQYASIVNILANKKIVNELLQNQFTYQNIIKNINHIIQKDNFQKNQNDYLECISSLNQEKVYYNTSKFILNK